MKVESIINYFDRESAEATEFRRLYSNLIGTGGGLKTVLVTSSIVEEGKTLISSFLAMTVAEIGRGKILLIDSDLRRPMVNVLFKMNLEGGFADLLEGKLKASEAAKPTIIPALKVITAGKITSSPTLIMNPTRIHQVLEELKFYYDFIIIDAPPTIPVSDPLLIAPETDGTLLVVRAGSTPKEVVKRACNLLSNARIKILGVVMNNCDEILPYHYSSKYYSYKYYHKPAEKTKA